MRVLHVGATDINGGAARAAYRIHCALKSESRELGIDSRMRVLERFSDDPTVSGGRPAVPRSIARKFERIRKQHSLRGFQSGNPVLHSTASVSTGLGAELKASAASKSLDLIHLHWLGDITLSIKEVGALPVPAVWTLHDQWAFCGAEHYTSPPPPGKSESVDRRFILGYQVNNRPSHESGPDINRLAWLQKSKYWKDPIQIVCPSSWLASCVRQSALMRDWPVSIIPYPIDLEAWAPVDQRVARNLLNLPQDRPLVLFGAINAGTDFRKGADLLAEALRHLRAHVCGDLGRLELVIYGQDRPQKPLRLGFPVHYTGSISSDVHLRLLYSAADVFVIPSRQDNLPNTGLEAHACGTPVVAFRTGGLVDIVDDGITGVLAQPFDSASLAAAIRSVLDDPSRRQHMAFAARERAEQLWNPRRIAGLYSDLYTSLLQA